MTDEKIQLPAVTVLNKTETTDLSLFGVPGMAVAVDPREAEDLGAFEDPALPDTEAWEASADEPDPAHRADEPQQS